jgi:S-DNA-T family DNA segregation ATPase FtsK/SpoIIIE
MPYLKEAADIRSLITQLTSCPILWLDTEVANWHTPNPRLSLIQVLAEPTDVNGDSAYILDVLDKPDLVTYFVNQIMVNPNIEKVFHNASFDVRYLGGKEQAKNITCTFKMVNKLTKKSRRNLLKVSNKKLKTLAVELCQFSNVDTEEQQSDWGRRPLSEKQVQYAKMDTVYLAHVHRHLLALYKGEHFALPKESTPEPTTVKSQDNSFSVTKVRVAFECPRLFYLAHRFGGKTMFLPPDRINGIGSAFHKLANDFISTAKREPQFQALFEPPAQQLSVEAIASEMQQLFYKLAFFPYLQATIQENPTQATALHQIWQALTRLIRHWAELLVKNRRYCGADALIRSTLIAGELKVEHNFTLPDGSQQRLIGKLDSLVFDFEQPRLCVVEFKTYEPADPSAQLAQVALYSYLLWQKKKVPVDSAVYCVLPEFKEYHYSWEQLENTVHQLTPHKLQQMRQWLTWEPPQPNPPPPTTQPHLCQICPQQEKCQTFFDVAGELENLTPQPPSLQGKGEQDSSLQPPFLKEARGDLQGQGEQNSPLFLGEGQGEGFSTKKPTVDADAIAKQLVATLQSFKIDVDYLGAAVGPAFIRVKLKPNLGVKVGSLLRLSADLQVQLGIANPPLISPQAGYVSVDLPRPDRQVASFEDYIQPQTTPPNSPVRIAIGVDLDGKLVEADLSDPNTCHFLVGGTTGSGKSEFLRSLLLSLLYRHSPQQLKIALVDPKRVTFPEFEQMPWLLSPVVKDSEDAIALMEQLVSDMEKRYRLFEAAGCSHLDAYNQQQTQRQKPLIPRIVCIFDEYADFMAEKETSKALELSIKRLGAMARAAGIHLIIATQRPEAKVVTPLIRSNLPGRVALRTASVADSEIILGGKQTEAAYLLGKGDLLYQVGAQLQRLQSLFAPKIQLPNREYRSQQISLNKSK